MTNRILSIALEPRALCETARYGTRTFVLAPFYAYPEGNSSTEAPRQPATGLGSSAPDTARPRPPGEVRDPAGTRAPPTRRPAGDCSITNRELWYRHVLLILFITNHAPEGTQVQT